MSFEIKLQKGDLGEKIITEYLEKKGWIVYRPFTKNKAHYFDMLCTLNKEKVIAIDVKTKARLNKWNAQGINIKTYNEYINFVKTTSVNFYLIFVDDKTGEVHLADLMKLKDPIYPNEKIIAWAVKDMKYLFTISENQIKELTKLDQRNYIFNPTKTQ
jgi:Holliday junction resolvase